MASDGRDSPMNWTVEEYLGQCHAAIVCGHITWDNQLKRFQEIADLGLTRNQVIDELKKLKAADHHKGPEVDHYQADASVHVFKYRITGISFAYVKLSLRTHPKRLNECHLKIWSFKRWIP